MKVMNNEVVDYPQFLSELEKEVESFDDVKNSYRKETARLSLSALKMEARVELFSSRESAYKTVSNLLPNVDKFRLQDVSKMLHVIFSDLRFKKNISDDLLLKLAQRKENRKSWLATKN